MKSLNIIIIIATIIGLFVFTTYVFFGIITLLGLVGLIESVPSLKWLAKRTANLIDILIFVLTIVATVQLGVTITASLTIAGLLYTAVYKPFLVKERELEKKTMHKHYIKF